MEMYLFFNLKKIKGTFWWPEGKNYNGEWLNNLMHGFGIYTWKVILYIQIIYQNYQRNFTNWSIML